MDLFTLVLLAGGVGYYAYRTGKRDGSQAAFRIGRRRGRRDRPQHRPRR